MSSRSNPEDAAGADLAADTAVQRVDKVPGLYVADLPDHWSYVHPSGGALATVALRAMTAELGPTELSLLSSTTLFCAPILPGELRVEVTVLRRGETAAQLRASLRAKEQPGPGLEVMATFAKDRTGPDMLGVRMPDVPRPEACARTVSRRFDGKRESFPFYRNIEIAQAMGDPMWEPGWRAGDAHIAYWHRYRVPQRDARGDLDPLAIPPIADTMPGSLARKLGPDEPAFIAPSLDLTVFFLDRTAREWLLVESFSERARAGYAVCSANVWDEDGKLVARAAQSMTLRPYKRA
jgi:acyl-CoA thioesterase